MSDTLVLKEILLGKGHGGFAFNFRTSQSYSWRFCREDDPQFALPAYNDATWVPRSSFFTDKEIAKDSLAGRTCWFRLRISVDSAAVAKPVALTFAGDGAMAVYLDGRFVVQAGSFKGESGGGYVSLSSRPAFISLPAPGTYVLAVRYENREALQYEDLSWGFSIVPQRASDLYQLTRNNMFVSSIALVGVGTVFLTLFLIHMLLFLFYRKEVSNLYFALFNLSVAFLLLLLYKGYVSDRIFLHNPINAVLMIFCCITGCFSLTAFTVQLFSKKKLVLWIMLVLSILMMGLSLVDIYSKTDYSSTAVLLLVLLSVAYTIIKIISAIYRKMPGAPILGAGVLVFFGTLLVLFGVVALVGEINLNNGIFMMLVLAVFSIPLSVSCYLAWRFSYVSRNLERQLVNVEQLSAEKQSILETQKEALEREVVERTREVVQQKKEIELEKQKSDELLLNILPSEIAEELKLKGESKAQLYDQATVLFTDFVNFTRISEQLGVEELLDELNTNFTAFDRIMEKYGLEKIKTIGDAYLAVSGLPAAHPRHAQHAVMAALDILDFVEARKKQVPYGLDIRIGINSGPLIAGIIGVKKFAYDIWGDTVNTAARMEQSGEAGKINVSENTCRLISDEFHCMHRGKIGAKNKGEMDMYFVVRKH